MKTAHPIFPHDIFKKSDLLNATDTAQCTVMRFLDLKETSTDMAADWIFEKFKLI